jgi:hypothetical protein
MARDRQQLAQACRILMRLSGLETEALWTAAGPTRRASWLKGYLRRDSKTGSRVLDQELPRQQKVVFLVAFDLWNGSGESAFRDVLDLPPRLVEAISSLMPLVGIRASSSRPEAELMAAWIARWGAHVTQGP